MTIITDNVRTGTLNGMAGPVGASGVVPTHLMKGVGDPSDTVTAVTGSDVFWDSANAQYYMALCGVGGSTWIKLGSVS